MYGLKLEKDNEGKVVICEKIINLPSFYGHGMSIMGKIMLT